MIVYAEVHGVHEGMYIKDVDSICGLMCKFAGQEGDVGAINFELAKLKNIAFKQEMRVGLRSLTSSVSTSTCRRF